MDTNKWKTHRRRSASSGVHKMSNSIEEGLKEALLKLKREMDSEEVSRESVDKAKVWSEMIKLREEIKEKNENNSGA